MNMSAAQRAAVNPAGAGQLSQNDKAGHERSEAWQPQPVYAPLQPSYPAWFTPGHAALRAMQLAL